MTDEVTTTVASQLASSPDDVNWTFWLLVLALSFVGSAAAQFFGAYLSIRGENFATKTDINNLLENVERTTAATERTKNLINRKEELRTQGVMELHALMCEIEGYLIWHSGVASTTRISGTPEVDSLEALRKAWELLPVLSNKAGYYVLVLDEEVYADIGEWSKIVMAVVADFGNPLEAKRKSIQMHHEESLEDRTQFVSELQQMHVDPALEKLGTARVGIQNKFKAMLGRDEI